jgi:hypothetical protein
MEMCMVKMAAPSDGNPDIPSSEADMIAAASGEGI